MGVRETLFRALGFTPTKSVVSRDSTRIHQRHPFAVSPTPKMPPHRRSRPRAAVPDPGADPPAPSLDFSPASPNLSTRSLDPSAAPFTKALGHDPRPVSTSSTQPPPAGYFLDVAELPPQSLSATWPYQALSPPSPTTPPTPAGVSTAPARRSPVRTPSEDSVSNNSFTLWLPPVRSTYSAHISNTTTT